jgi:hypothetical protein
VYAGFGRSARFATYAHRQQTVQTRTLFPTAAKMRAANVRKFGYGEVLA